MSNETRNYKLGCITLILFNTLVWVLLILAICCGCTRTVYVPTDTHHYHTDSVRVAVLSVDTLMQHDSIYVERNGDTTLIVRYRDRYRVKEVHDTVAKEVVKVDSISVPYPVEKTLTKWQQTKMDFGAVGIGAVGVIIAFIINWIIKKIRQ